MSTFEVYIGVDVSKATLELSVFDTRKSSVPNTVAGIRSLLMRVEKLGTNTLICCEATGGYEKQLVAACHECDFPVAVVNARQVRDFAKSKGILAKTDAIDAAVIAAYAEQNSPRETPPPTPWQQSLKAFHQRREELKRMILQEENRLENLSDRWISASIRSHIRSLEKQIKQLEKRIEELVQAEPDLKRFCERFMKVKGVGLMVSSGCAAYLPEMGRVTDNQLVALAGLAPHCQDSGSWRGQRHISGGRAGIRRLLYMPAVNATGSNPIFRDFYRRLKAQGKPSKVAITAVMRKLVCLANRIASDPDFTPA